LHYFDNKTKWQTTSAITILFPVQAPDEEFITDSCPGYHYLNMCMHPSGHPDGDLSLAEIREQSKETISGRTIVSCGLTLPLIFVYSM
jgi:hypothetical protein